VFLFAVLCINWTGCALVEKGAGRRSECSRIAGLSGTGEHKPAVDAARELGKSGGSCPPQVSDALSISQSKLEKADSYVHKALARRKEGNLLSARANLQRALEVYPKYYWVQTLIRNIDRSIQAELDSLANEASYLEANGDPAGALSRVQDAMTLSPEDQELVLESVRLQDLIRKSRADQNVEDILNEARAHLEADRFDEAQEILTGKNAADHLGTRGGMMLEEVLDRRHEHIRRRFDEALEREKEGDLDAAADTTLDILELSVSGDRDSTRIVEFSRLLGMKLYSAGELSRARDLWARALKIDPENARLQSYLKEVETRLNNLDRIKKGGMDKIGK